MSGMRGWRIRRAVLLLNLGTVEHTLRCSMGDDSDQQADVATLPSHDVALSALLPDAPSGKPASTEASGATPKEPCVFFDYGIGMVHLQLAAEAANDMRTLQLGIFELRMGRVA